MAQAMIFAETGVYYELRPGYAGGRSFDKITKILIIGFVQDGHIYVVNVALVPIKESQVGAGPGFPVSSRRSVKHGKTPPIGIFSCGRLFESNCKPLAGQSQAQVVCLYCY